MTTYRATATALIDAPAERVYGIIADYEKSHGRILPKPYFQSLTVEQGGVGAGTVVRFEMPVMGQLRTFRSAITEPEPGRVLVEATLDGQSATTFTVDPRAEGRQAQVTITTESQRRPGPAGWLEAWLGRQYLRQVYAAELKQLAEVAKA